MALQVSSLATSPAVVVWSNGVAFDGYVELTLSLPTGYTRHVVKGSAVPLTIPTVTRVPIVAGVINPDTKLYYNSDVNPPGTQYTGIVRDVFGISIASLAAPVTVTAATTTLTIPTLNVPS